MRALAVPLLVMAALVAGCGGSSAAKPAKPAASGTTVDIKAFKYKPVTVTVRKGGTVRWTNSDTAAHTATADDRSFDTQAIDKGAARMVTFTSAGTFAYHCDFHPFMKATVVVK
jgi:plastocyanin